MKFGLSVLLFIATLFVVSTSATKPTFGVVTSKVTISTSSSSSSHIHVVGSTGLTIITTYPDMSIVKASSLSADDDDINNKDHLLQVRGGAANVAASSNPSSNLMENLTICFYFLAWYALNVIYNSELF